MTTTTFSQRVKIPGAEGIGCDVLVTSEPESIARWIFNFLVKQKVMVDDPKSYTALLEEGVFTMSNKGLRRRNDCVIAALDIDVPHNPDVMPVNNNPNKPDGVPPPVTRKRKSDFDCIPVRGPYGILLPPIMFGFEDHQHNNNNPDDDGIPVPVPPVLKLSGLDPTTKTVSCAIFQLQAGKEMPVCLQGFLNLQCAHFLMEKPDKISYLKRALKLRYIKAYDLQGCAVDKYKDDRMNLEQLLHRATGITTYVKPAAIIESDWSGPLTPTQCIYAAADCYWIMHLVYLYLRDQWAE